MLFDIVIMRWSVLTTLALLVGGAVASPVKEESLVTVGVAETVTPEDSHFIVTVQRYLSSSDSSRYSLMNAEQTTSNKTLES